MDKAEACASHKFPVDMAAPARAIFFRKSLLWLVDMASSLSAIGAREVQ